MRLPTAVNVLWCGWLAACHTGATSTPSRSVHSEAEHVLAPANAGSEPVYAERGRSSDVAPAVAPIASSARPVEAPAMRVHYALAAELARAELRRGDSLLFDFGEPSEDKYTLGGWQTFAGEAKTFGTTRALLVRGKSAKFLLPADTARAQRLSLRIRSFAATSITILLAGKRIAERKLDGDDFQTLDVELPTGALRHGENLIELRIARSSSVRGIADAGLALDFAMLAPRTAPAAPQAPPAPSELAPSPNTLQIPEELRLGYTLEIPAGGELRASAHADAPAQLNISALRDGTRSVELASLKLGAGETPLRVSLASLAGDVTRIELAAHGGTVTLDHPVIVEPGEAVSVQRKPIRNVIVMLIDTLRADKLKPYNPKTRVRTPGLMRFLEDAVTMRDARTQENWTKPSVATLLSSLFPWQHNAFTGDARVPESVELLPEYFQKRGFVTAAFIANGYVSDKFGFGQGWTNYRNYIRENRRSIAQEVAGDVLEWLDARPQAKPFFLYVHTIDPHVPYRPPKDFLAMYDPAPYSGPVDFSRSALVLEHIKLGKLTVNDRDKLRLQALYDGEISYHDVHFAAMLDGLDKRGLRDDTMVVITSDHGEEFWDHGSVGHGHSVYDELLHVPLMVRLPGVTEANATLPGNVGLVDIAPTILEAMNLPVPDSMFGHSFLPVLLGAPSSAPRATASGFMTGFRTLAVGRLKLVQRGLDHTALYDVQEDPGETRDLAPERPIALRYARGLLGLTLAGSRGGQVSGTVRHKKEKTKIDAATEAQLRALGYVGTSQP